MTPEERAAAITKGWTGIEVYRETEETRERGSYFVIRGCVTAIAEQIAAAIREAVAEATKSLGD